MQIAETAPYLRVFVPATESWLITRGPASRLSIGINELTVEGESLIPEAAKEDAPAPVAASPAQPALAEEPTAPTSRWAKLIPAGR